MPGFLSESNAQGVVGFDEAGRVTSFSAAAEHLLGHRADDVLGRDFHELFVPERLRERSRASYAGLVAGDEAPGRTVTAPVLTADGFERPMAMTLFDAGAPPTRFTACFSPDVGDLGLDVPALSLVGIFTVHARSGRVEMSETLWRMHGLDGEPPAMTLFEYFERFVVPEDREALRIRAKQRVDGEQVPELSYWRAVTPKGEVRSFLSEGRGIYTDAGALERTIGVVRDVTEGESTRRALLVHRTVNEALDHWDDPRGGVVGVVRSTVEAMGWSAGATWQMNGGGETLDCQVFWRAPGAPAATPHEVAVRAQPETARLPQQAWASGEVVAQGCEGVARSPLPEVAVPVLDGGVPMAVLHFWVAPGQWLAEELRQALGEIGRGRLAEFFVRHRAELGLSPLTDREQQVLQMAANGNVIHAIAAQLGISESTVKTHFEHIYAKLAVSDRGGAVAEGFRQGLIS